MLFRSNPLSHDEKDKKIEELEQRLKLAERRVEQLAKLRDFDRAEAEPYSPPRGDTVS